MPAFVYILHSLSLGKFYIGATSLKPQDRLDQHNNKHYLNKFTAKGIPWTLFYYLECENFIQAQKIELHLKKMKNKTYYNNLKIYPEISKKLLDRYKL